MNFIAVLGAALIPTVIGFLWYNPKIFGNAWMAAAGLTEEQVKGTNMVLVLGLSLLLSAMLSLILTTLVIHQMHFYSLFDGFTDPASQAEMQGLLTTYGDRFRSFGHGALHGTIAGFFIVLPVLGSSALFERKSFKYIAINVGYWTLTLALMGGVLCQFV